MTAFRVKDFNGKDLKEGEAVVKPKVYYPYNYTTLYSIVIRPLSNHASYTIRYRVQEIDAEFTTILYLTTKRGVLKFLH